MPFNPEPTRVPVDIGNIVVWLKDAIAADEEPAYQSAYFDVKIILSDGTAVTRRGDLVSHITPAQRQVLMDFMDDLRIQAEVEIIT